MQVWHSTLSYIEPTLMLFKAVKVEMEELTDPTRIPMAVHGTTQDAWKKIGPCFKLLIVLSSLTLGPSQHLKASPV